MVICLERGADLHMAQLIPLPLTVCCFIKIQIGLPFWYRLTRVVPDKGPLNGCVCVCVFARHMHLFRISVLNVVYVSFALEVFTVLLSSFKNGLRYVTHTHTHTHARMHAHTHTHTRLTTLCPVSRYPKGKTNLDFTGARDSEWQWHQLGHMQVCT